MHVLPCILHEFSAAPILGFSFAFLLPWLLIQLPAGALHDCVNRLRSELDEDVMASTVQSGISLDRRGYVRCGGPSWSAQPLLESVCTPPEDMAAASDDSSPALRESELGYPTQNAPCVSCELLRTEIAALRNELHLARSAEFNAIPDMLCAPCSTRLWSVNTFR